MPKIDWSDKNARLNYQREYYKDNKTSIDKAHLKYRKKHRKELALYSKEWAKKNKKKRAKVAKEYKDKIKLKVLQHYSGYEFPFCKCCEISIFEFLTIDHINANGNKHRQKIKGWLYNWLISHDFPKGYCVLCFNCNCSKRNGNTCLGHNKRIK